jgi:hypothetical protein
LDESEPFELEPHAASTNAAAIATLAIPAVRRALIDRDIATPSDESMEKAEAAASDLLPGLDAVGNVSG